MIRAWVVAAGLAGLAATAGAQRPPAAAKADTALRERLLALRDTVEQVSGAIVDFRRDLRTAGPETITAKAGRLTQACAAARAEVDASVPAFAPGAVPRSARAAADSLRATLAALAAQLDRECLRGLRPEGPGTRADTLRAWGPYRTAQLRRAITLFQNDANRMATALGFKLPVRSSTEPTERGRP